MIQNRQQRPWHERIRRRFRRNFKVILLAILLSALAVSAFEFSAVLMRIYGGLLIMQGRYYTPKDTERMRQMQEEKAGQGN